MAGGETTAAENLGDTQGGMMMTMRTGATTACVVTAACLAGQGAHAAGPELRTASAPTDGECAGTPHLEGAGRTKKATRGPTLSGR